MTVIALERAPRRHEPARQPVPIVGEPGLFVVDATWGTIQPLRLPGIETVGELEVIEHLERGGLVVDTRQPEQAATGTIPGAVAIRHQEIAERLGEIAAEDDVVVLYCNGPQCAATPRAVEALLAAGWPAERLRYYRGGIHDWVTLGLPLAR